MAARKPRRTEETGRRWIFEGWKGCQVPREMVVSGEFREGGQVLKVLKAIPNIGVTPDIRPEEVKHIQYVNIGFSLLAATNLGFFIPELIAAKTLFIIPLAQLSFAILCIPVFILNRLRWYTLARVYGFLLFYANCFFIFPLSGKEVADHYFVFTAFGYAFFVFPRRQKALMIAVIILGILCYAAILVQYEHVEPVLKANLAAAKMGNQVIFYVIMLAFIILMVSGKYFMDEMEDSLKEEREKIAEMSSLLKKMFGRYLSTEVMNSLIENPSALELGGERRSVTIMMTDLRGFTALSERLEPEKVVQMLNTYFEVMVEVVLKYNGTINEIIGDALLVIFGAPQEMPDRAQRAIACSVEMQNAMAQVNKENRSQGLPELEMGIGLNETEVVVGNIGSSKRSKYAVVGSGVNMTSRIESYAVGGQILISESVRRQAGEILRIDAQRDVLPKGSEKTLRIYEVGGIAGDYNLVLGEKVDPLVALTRKISLGYTILDGKDIAKKSTEAFIIGLSKNCAEIEFGTPVEIMTNIKMNLRDVDENLSSRDFYGKVTKCSQDKTNTCMVHFTSVPSEVDAYFQAIRQYIVK